MNKLYVVTMYRWGDCNKHSYVLGVFDNEVTAKMQGIKEETFRGGKYSPDITDWNLNKTFTDEEEELDDHIHLWDYGWVTPDLEGYRCTLCGEETLEIDEDEDEQDSF